MMIHKFQPTIYHPALGSFEPVLYLEDGDIVCTTTIDAHGRDATDKQVSLFINPQTGPFYVENAEPGDTLVVHLDKLQMNRRTGWSGTVIASNIVDPDFVRQMPPHHPHLYAEWDLDLNRGIATLIKPETNLGSLTLPIKPMLGCVGVAPSLGQAISSTTSGTHGGNMDYKGFVSGVTIYFPVFVSGGLFFLGDGHAIQGAGEIVGTGIETSFDVQFTIQVYKEKQIIWPRAENEEYIFTMGNARPLDQALQHATTEMIRWLKDDYDLSGRAAHILLGQCVEYEVGNVYDPAYTMVCKLKKSRIPAKSTSV